MTKKVKNLGVKAFFNASVVLASCYSPTGGSAKLLSWCKEGKIQGFISEIVLGEILKNLLKTKGDYSLFGEKIKFFKKILPIPDQKEVKKYDKVVLDRGDAHVLASCEEGKANYLVTLDKKHLLSLKKKIKHFNIVNPGELISIFHEKIKPT